MAESRQTTINMDAVQLTRLRETVGADKLNQAIGYLSTWNMTFPVCHISVDRELPDLVAYYFSGAGDCRYVIGAVWHDDHYGFHS